MSGKVNHKECCDDSFNTDEDVEDQEEVISSLKLSQKVKEAIKKQLDNKRKLYDKAPKDMREEIMKRDI